MAEDFSSAVSRVQRLPSGPTYKEIKIATVDDLDGPFDLRMNIYLPKVVSEEPCPLVVYIHGNGGAYNYSNGSNSYELAIALSERGVAVATADYRPRKKWPENIYDVKAYIRFLRAHAQEYNIDPGRIAVWGTSRGGHLAAMLAASGEVEELEGDVGGNTDVSSCIQAAVIFYPIIDLFLYDIFPAFAIPADNADAAGIKDAYQRNDTTSPLWKYVEIAVLCNPIRYVTQNSAPVLIAIGAQDAATPLHQSLAFYNKYIEMGGDASLYTWTKGTHGIVGEDIEAAASEWMIRKLLVDHS